MAWIYRWGFRLIAMVHLVGANLGSHGFGMRHPRMAWIYRWACRFIAMALLVGANLGSHGFGMRDIHAWRGSTRYSSAFQ